MLSGLGLELERELITKEVWLIKVEVELCVLPTSNDLDMHGQLTLHSCFGTGTQP